MSDPSRLRQTLEGLREQPDQLIEIILRQAAAIQEMQKQIQELQKQISDLNDRNNGLSSKVEALEKTAARQAAPFRIADKHRSAEPKKPGRPKGPEFIARFPTMWIRRSGLAWSAVHSAEKDWPTRDR